MHDLSHTLFACKICKEIQRKVDWKPARGHSIQRVCISDRFACAIYEKKNRSFYIGLYIRKSIFTPRSAIRNPQSAIFHPLSSAINTWKSKPAITDLRSHRTQTNIS